MRMRLQMVCLVLGMFVPGAAGGHAQEPAHTGLPTNGAEACATSLKSFVLKNATLQNDGNEVLTALRNMLPPTVHVFYVSTQNIVFMCGAPEWQAMAERMVREMDKPRNRYKVTYTFTETDGGKRVGTQHYSMLVTAGQRMTVKEGSRVPVATGSVSGSANPVAVQTQYQYVDVGMNFDVTLMETAGGALVKTKVEQSGMVPSANQMQPVIRQAMFEGSPTVVLGKPAIVTSMDMPESTRHVDVEVVVEAVP